MGVPEASQPWAKARSLNTPIDMHLLDYVSGFDNNLMCPICRSPFVDPVALDGCDHCFCRNCLRQTWNLTEYTPGIPKGRCPTCRTDSCLIGRGGVSRILVNILDELVVKCPRHEEGCESTITRSEVQGHVGTYCGYTWVVCPSADCGLPVRRKDVRECLHFGVTCIDCRHTTHMASLESHWKKDCPDRKVLCEQCTTSVFYREINLHARETCSAITIPCTGATYGCTFRSKRGAINQHTKSCVFASIAPFFAQQKQQLEEQAEKQTLLERKLKVLEGGFKSLQEMLDEPLQADGGDRQDADSGASSVEQILEVGQAPIDTTLQEPELVVIPTDFNDEFGFRSELSTPHISSPSASQRRSDPNIAWPLPNDNFPPPDEFISATTARQSGPYSSPYHHLLCLHENLRDEVSRVTTSLHELEGRHGMMILNENLRLKEDLAYFGGQVGGLSRQVGWLTSSRLQTENTRTGSATNVSGTGFAIEGLGAGAASGQSAGVGGGSRLGVGRRTTDEGRTKL